jgi:hypothetical protein
VCRASSCHRRLGVWKGRAEGTLLNSRDVVGRFANQNPEGALERFAAVRTHVSLSLGKSMG